MLLKENENWKGSYYVDLREPCWTTRVTGELVPAILAQGFNGVFLDTLDNPIELEHSDPAKYRGMKQAAAGMVREIRRRFPRITIMMNRAYELLPGVEQSIDIVLGESVFATYDFSKKTYHLVDREEYLQQVKVLKQAKARRPALRVLTLDYWNPADTKGLTRIYREERANGFEPYVSTIELDRVIREPR